MIRTLTTMFAKWRMRRCEYLSDYYKQLRDGFIRTYVSDPECDACLLVMWEEYRVLSLIYSAKARRWREYLERTVMA